MLGQHDPQARRLRADVEQPRPQRRVGRDPAADDDRVDPRRSRRARAASSTSTSTTAAWNDAATSATVDVGVLAHVLHDRGLQAREREVVAVVEHRARERGSRRDRPRARAGRSRDRRDSRGRGSARPCRTPRPRRRRRSGRARGTARGPSIAIEQRVTARHDERDERRLERRDPRAAPRTCAPRDGCTPTYGSVGRERDRLGRAHADEQRAREPGPVHRGDRVDVVERRRPPRPAPAR